MIRIASGGGNLEGKAKTDNVVLTGSLTAERE
jgi:hypothetical protein